MATIKDIAKEAGVAQGTVSNVLNGKGNVSSDKILLVERAAAKLGYTTNQRAKTLRKGASNLLAVLLPDIIDRKYVDFYLSFKHYAESHGYSVNLYLTNDNAQTEIAMLSTIRSEMAAGLAAFTSQVNSKADVYSSAGFTAKDVIFLERAYQKNWNYLGFDYHLAGYALAQKCLDKSFHNVILVTENLEYSSQREFYDGFVGAISPAGQCCVRTIQTDSLHCNNHFLQILSEAGTPDAIFFSDQHLAECYYDIEQTFYPDLKPTIYVVTPLQTMPSTNFRRYELNYRLLGKTAAKHLIKQHKAEFPSVESEMLPNDGLCYWLPDLPVLHKERKQLTVLTLDSPTARAMENVSRLYMDGTGIDVKIAISSYDGIHEILSSESNLALYDVIRLDHTWLPWFGEKIFTPLEQLDPNIAQTFGGFLQGLHPRYTSVQNVIYSLPETPSAQMLFYRKDLFESTVLQRLYKEQYHEDLIPPKDYVTFNHIARFFTRQFNPHSPVSYGTTLTLGNSGVAATEYLSRYFSHSTDLFASDGQLLLDTDAALQAMQELDEVKKYCSKTYSTWWRGTARVFAQGDTAMTVLFSNYASELLNNNSVILDKIGYAAVPGGNPLLGGGSIGVCKYSRHPQEALSFIRWLCSEKVATVMTLLGSVSPCEKTYNNYEILDNYPWLSLSKKLFSTSKINRVPPHLESGFNERKFLGILGIAVNNVYNGTLPADKALEQALNDYQKSFLE